MVFIMILATSHAGVADEEDDTVSSNQINIFLTIPQDCNPRNEMEKRAWNRGFYLGIGKRLSENSNLQGRATLQYFLKFAIHNPLNFEESSTDEIRAIERELEEDTQDFQGV